MREYAVQGTRKHDQDYLQRSNADADAESIKIEWGKILASLTREGKRRVFGDHDSQHLPLIFHSRTYGVIGICSARVLELMGGWRGGVR